MFQKQRKNAYKISSNTVLDQTFCSWSLNLLIKYTELSMKALIIKGKEQTCQYDYSLHTRSWLFCEELTLEYVPNAFILTCWCVGYWAEKLWSDTAMSLFSLCAPLFTPICCHCLPSLSSELFSHLLLFSCQDITDYSGSWWEQTWE